MLILLYLQRDIIYGNNDNSNNHKNNDSFSCFKNQLVCPAKNWLSHFYVVAESSFSPIYYKLRQDHTNDVKSLVQKFKT